MITCRPFGRIEQTDIRRRPDHNDAFAFVVFEDISDSMRAVKSLGSSTDINGVEVKIGYSTSSKVRSIKLILHLILLFFWKRQEDYCFIERKQNNLLPFTLSTWSSFFSCFTVVFIAIVIAVSVFNYFKVLFFIPFMIIYTSIFHKFTYMFNLMRTCLGLTSNIFISYCMSSYITSVYILVYIYVVICIYISICIFLFTMYGSINLPNRIKWLLQHQGCQQEEIAIMSAVIVATRRVLMVVHDLFRWEVCTYVRICVCSWPHVRVYAPPCVFVLSCVREAAYVGEKILSTKYFAWRLITPNPRFFPIYCPSTTFYSLILIFTLMNFMKQRATGIEIFFKQVKIDQSLDWVEKEVEKGKGRVVFME